MLTLCGFAASNYYNKVKIALLEKGVDFTEQLAWVGEVDRQASPLGKVPYLITDQGSLCESAVMLEYIEQRYPQHPLLPSDPFAAAKVRELVTFLDLHLELVARNLYPEALFGSKVSGEVKEKTKAQLDKNMRAFAKLARFDPYLAGNTLGLADCAAIVHFPLISAATKVIYGQDLFADLPVREYLKRMAERPYMARVQAERKANAELMMARIKAKSAAS
jgi:glutathione S-transferase